MPTYLRIALAVTILAMAACSPAVPEPGTPPIRGSAVAQQPAAQRFTRNEVVEARKHYDVQMLSFDQSNVFGQGYDQSNLLRVRVTNNSTLTLQQLTVLTKRWSSTGEFLGSSRAPSIPVRDLKPGESAEFDYYSKGALPGTARITVEVERLLEPENEQFIAELPK